MRVDFFFGPGSRYAYLAATQLPRIARETGAVFRWRALFSGDLIERAGGVWRGPQDPAYRSLDVRRWARRYGVAYEEPSQPCDWRRLALACVAAAGFGVAEPFATRLFTLVYGLGRAPADADLAAIVEDLGLAPAEFLKSIQSGPVAASYEANVTDALAAGAFGVPTFVTGSGALIWGQDRLPLLEDCLRNGDVAP